jgi:hypothetical protein
MIKKVQKLMNTPVKKEIYEPSGNMYVSDKGLHPEDHSLDPNRILRMTQVDVVARLLLQQVNRLEVVNADRGSEKNNEMGIEIEGTFAEIDIVLEELSLGVLFTDAEKAEKRLQRTSLRSSSISAGDDTTINLGDLKAHIQGWQHEKLLRKKKFNRIERSISDLSLNVNDVRCSQISSDRRMSAAALDSTIDLGVPLLRDVHYKLQLLYVARQHSA